MTPEAKVKKRVKAMLSRLGVYYFMPIGGPFSTAGVPDIVCCIQSHFVGIECKAKGNTVTALQRRHLEQITASYGVAVVVDETCLDILERFLEELVNLNHPPSKSHIAGVLELTYRKYNGKTQDKGQESGE